MDEEVTGETHERCGLFLPQRLSGQKGVGQEKPMKLEQKSSGMCVAPDEAREVNVFWDQKTQRPEQGEVWETLLGAGVSLQKSEHLTEGGYCVFSFCCCGCGRTDLGLARAKAWKPLRVSQKSQTKG